MKHKKEVILHFPLRKKNEIRFNEENIVNPDSDIKEELKKFYSLTSRLQNDEWHQEYFLIYNSYTIDKR
jgi:hypothetical protein